MGQCSSMVYRASGPTLEDAVANLELQNRDKSMRVIKVSISGRKLGKASSTFNPKTGLWAVYFKQGWELGDGYIP